MATIPLHFGGGGGASSSDVTASKAQVLSGYTAITSDSNDEPIEGTIPLKGEATYNTSTSDQTIAAGQYLDGIQTIKGVKTSGIAAASIKKDVVIKVGDSADDDRLVSTTGTYSTISSGQKAAVAGSMLSGYSAFANGGSEVKGNIGSKAAATYNTSKTDQSVASGQYLSGAQTIKAVTTSNLSAGNIKKGVVVKVGDANDADRIVNITGSYTTPSSGQSGVTAATLESGYSAFVNGGSEIKGAMSKKAAATYNTSTSDQSIAASQYMNGVQTIKAVKTANISAGNIKKGVVIKVGDANSATRIHNVTGTYTTPSSGQSAITAANMVSGYSAFVNGGTEIKGTATGKAAATYNTSTSDQTIAANQWLTGAQTIRGVTTANISAANIKKGVTVSVGDANDADRILSVTGTYTTISSGQTAVVAGKLAKGYSAFANGGAEVKGSVTAQGTKTWTPTTSNQTIAKDVIITGTQTISGNANLVAANIASGKNIFGVAGTFHKYKKYTASVAPSSSKVAFTYASGSNYNMYYITITAHGMTPTVFGAGMHYYNSSSYSNKVYTVIHNGTYFMANGNQFKITGNAVYSSSKIQAPVYSNNGNYSVVVVGY